MNVGIKKSYGQAKRENNDRLLKNYLCSKCLSNAQKLPCYWAKEIVPSLDLSKKFAINACKWEDYKENHRLKLRNDIANWNNFFKNINPGAKLTLLYGAPDTENIRTRITNKKMPLS